MVVLNLRRKDLPHVTMTSAKLRALLHEAWKHGNNSTNIDSEPAGERERHIYVSQVMIEKGFKEAR